MFKINSDLTSAQGNNENVVYIYEILLWGVLWRK